MRRLALLAFVLAIHAQDPAGILGALRLTNVEDPAQLRLVLLNAAGADCQRTVILDGGLPFRMPGAPPNAPSDAAEVQIAPHVESGCWTRKDLSGLLVMAPNRAVAFVPGAFLNLGLTNYHLELRPPRDLIIEVWPAADEFVSAAHDDLANLDWLLESQRAGLRLRPRFHPVKESPGKISCDTAPFQPSYRKGVINLYYGAGRSNESCIDNSAVLIHNIPVLGDVAHEIGHKLGLNQADSERDYDAGHTTDQPGFTCDNIMWTLSEVLKHDLSLGQAAWLGLSCNSFLGAQGACLACSFSGSSQGPSPCPRFSLRPPQVSESSTGCPFNCPVDDAKKLLARQPSLETPNPDGRARLCTRADLRRRLADRFNALRAHVQSRPDLALSTGREEVFVASWMDRIATILTIESIWKNCQINPQSGKPVANPAELRYLEEQFRHGPLKNHDYLMYARDKLNQGVYAPRCDSGRPPKLPSQP